MDIQTLSRQEQIELYHQLGEALGWHGVVVLCVEDVANYIEQEGEPVPSNEVLNEVCAYVARKAEEEHWHLWARAAEVAREYQEV